MIRQVPINARQAELILAAHKDLEQSREKQQLNALLSGIASGLEGTLVNVDMDQRHFNIEVPDIQEEKKDVATQ